jgi:hypothetical protein
VICLAISEKGRGMSGWLVAERDGLLVRETKVVLDTVAPVVLYCGHEGCN